MKKDLSQLLILIPLLFIAGVSFAAYDYVGPACAPPGCNTDVPLDGSASSQVKNGGLSVNAFYVPGNAYFDQNSYVAGAIFGPVATNNTVVVGTSAAPTGVANTGNIFISGQYQSETLKTGGGKKPLCADTNGTFYICGQ
ncbi:MAG: hypothetical protein JWL92_248 [Candidatus Nomurabacteria bacterium]|nr:hypothetical protein [Candidatus Nomurabacteria bacterium]